MKKLLLVSILVLTTGCVSTSVQRVDNDVRAARSPERVSVLTEVPRQPHTVIAVVEAKGKTIFDSFGDLQKEMVAEAAKLGGDALVLGPEMTDTEFIITGTAMIRSDEKNLTGAVIAYK